MRPARVDRSTPALMASVAQPLRQAPKLELLVDLFLQAAEGAVDGVLRPCRILGIPEQRAGGASLHQCREHIGGVLGEINHPVTLLSLGFLRRQDDALDLEVDVPRLDDPDLLRAYTQLP